MGRTLDLSQLTDAEAEHVWGVIQRDLDLRRREEERLRGLRGKLEREQSAQHQGPSEGAPGSPPHCACHLQPCPPGEPCQDCGHARPCHHGHLPRVAQLGALEWYYGHLRTRFKHFGSAKVIRSLSGRLQTGALACVSGAALRAGQDSGDSEQTDEEADPLWALQQPLGGKAKRRLSIYGDLLDSQEVAVTPTDSLEALTGEPGAEGTLLAEDEDAPGAQRSSPPARPQDTLALHCPPARAGPEGLSATAGPEDPAELHAAPQGLAPFTTDRESAGARRETPLWSQGSSPRAPESQGPEPTDADREEAALRRELAQLLTHLSEDEDEDEEAGADAGPRGTLGAQLGAAPKVLRAEPHPQNPGSPAAASRTRDAELVELEGRVAAAASEVQQAENEVMDVQSRIAALQAAGLTLRPAGAPQRKSNLPVLLPRAVRRPGRSPGDPHADAATQDQVAAAPRTPGATLKSSPRALGGSFERESLYRSSLTQRNPSQKAAARLGFAKPVMTQQP